MALRQGYASWYGMMGVGNFTTNEVGLTFKTQTPDPAIERALDAIPAKQVARIVVRMKVADAKAGDSCQLFWQMGSSPASETTMLRLPVIPGNQFHDYLFEVGAHRQWRGRINKLRFDPVNQRDVTVTVEGIRLMPASE